MINEELIFNHNCWIWKYIIQIDYNSSTLSDTDCVCGFDPYQKLIDPQTDLPFDCACCPDGASQCGYPMHNFCKYDFDEPNQGCEGLKLWFFIYNFQNWILSSILGSEHFLSSASLPFIKKSCVY